ncbi:MAG TPA: M20/M25/M40 family metallo-hydrolase [Thermoanaerobaculia bacterium]|nr:M20/M25/M40 family metallo-hydrolase [Thermoanaerobaculia bacterium]
MKAVIAAALIFVASAALAQDAVEKTAKRIIDAELAGSKSYDTLSYLTDEIGARPSGSKSAELAVKWTTQQFRSWGIDVHTENVMVPHWVRGVERGRLVSHNNQKIVLTALGGSVATPADGITAEVVEVKSYEELQSLGKMKIKGKIVYYNNPMNLELVRSGRAFEAYSDAVVFRGSGASHAAEYGAVAAVIRSVASASLRTPHTGAMRYDEKQPKIPAAAMTTEDAELVHRLIARGDKVRMHLVLTPKTLPDVQSQNVIAEIKGTERPDEIVLIGGHLDSWDLGTGAIDDGSGVAMVMETMRLLKELDIHPRRTIRAVLFMNEENGLKGGKNYFERRKDTELSKHIAAIETDAGSAIPTGYITTLHGDALEQLKKRAAVLNTIAPMVFESSKHTGADTSFLTDAGVPGFGLVPDSRHYFDYHHTPADTLDKVDAKELAQCSAAVAALAYIIAESGL